MNLFSGISEHKMQFNYLNLILESIKINQIFCIHNFHIELKKLTDQLQDHIMFYIKLYCFQILMLSFKRFT